MTLQQLPLLPDTEQQAKSQTARSARYSARLWLLKNSNNDRVRGCGLTAIKGRHVSVRLGTCPTTGNRKAGASNLMTCGSIWLCPTCSFKTASVRSNDLAQAFKTWNGIGGEMLFATFTLRHTPGMTLAEVWDGLNSSWKTFLGGKGWKSLKVKWGLSGFVRAVEITHGKNGWHVHAHTVFFLNVDESRDLDKFTKSFSSVLFNRWKLAVESQGLTAEKYGFDVRRTYSDSPLARYMSKSVGAEMAHGNLKSSRTPFSILYKLTEKNQTKCSCKGPKLPGARCDFCLWREWENTATGRRQLSWSVGMRNLIEVTAVDETTDDYILDSEVVLAIGVGSWQKLYRSNQLMKLYEIIENESVTSAEHFLTKRKCVYYRLSTLE